MLANATDAALAVCQSTFSQELFGYFLEEECVAARHVDGGSGCPVTDAEDFLRLVLGDLQIGSLMLAPWTLLFFILLTFGGGVPRTETIWGKVVFAVWLATQIGTLVFYFASLAAYIMAYTFFHWQFHGCYHLVGSAPILHLVMIAGAGLHPALLNRFWPIFFVAGSIHEGLKAEVGKSELRENIFWAMVLVCVAPVFVSLLFNVGTMSALFGVVFVPIPLLAMVCYSLAAFALCILIRRWHQHFPVGFNRVQDTSGIPFEILEDGVESAPLFAPLVFMIFPALFWGQALAFLVYAGNDGGPAIGTIYRYTMDPLNFRAPALVDFQALLQVFDVSDWLESLFEAQPAEALSVAAVLAAFSTTISVVRTVFVTGSSLVYKATNGSLGARTRQVFNPNFRPSERGSAGQRPPTDKE